MNVLEQEIDLTGLLHGVSLVSDENPDFVTARLIIDSHCDLGEGVIYDDRRHAVLWTDINGKRFHRLQLSMSDSQNQTVKYTTYDLPKKLCSFGMFEADKADDKATSRDPLPLLCAWEDGFQIYDIAANKPLSEMSQGEDVNPAKGNSRLNDGRVDPTGKVFVCGGFFGGPSMKGTKMKVFRCQQPKPGSSLTHSPIRENIEITNSITWSPDGKTMYLADSPTKKIWKCAYDSSAEASATLEGADTAPVMYERTDDGSPDGSCVDTDGYVWNAVWRDGLAPGMVQRIDPTTGRVDFTVHMPDSTSQVSCCCFGGEKMDILFITTAAEGMDPKKEPHAGGLYAAKVPYTGRREYRLDFTW